MSQPMSVKWILPFRDFMDTAFKTLPITLAGTSAFFAANTASPFFVLLTGILAFIIPLLVGITQILGGFVHNKLVTNEYNLWIVIPSYLISLGLAAAGLAPIACGSSVGDLLMKFLPQIGAIIFAFIANAGFGNDTKEGAASIKLLPNMSCNMVGTMKDERKSVLIAPSFWLTPIVFLTTYLFSNSYDNYNKPAREKSDPMKVTKRKIQSIFAMTSILAIGLALILARIFVTGCESGISVVTSILIGVFVGRFFYVSIANPQGIDAFNMFQSINYAPSKDYKCFRETDQ